MKVFMFADADGDKNESKSTSSSSHHVVVNDSVYGWLFTFNIMLFKVQ